MYWSLLYTHLGFYWGTALLTELYGTEKGSLDFIQIAPLVLFNQLAVTAGVIGVMDWVGVELVELEVEGMNLDWFFGNVLAFVGAVLAMNFLFFVAHLGAHKWGWMYRVVHKVHHQLVVPVGYGALYCHPLEQLLVNLGPVVVALRWLSGWDWWLVHCFVAFVSVETVLGHTVYRDVGSDCGKGSRHYFHHFERGCNYGNSRYFEDRAFGTFRDWGEREHSGEQRGESRSDDERQTSITSTSIYEGTLRKRRSRKRASSPEPIYDEVWQSASAFDSDSNSISSRNEIDAVSTKAITSSFASPEVIVSDGDDGESVESDY